MIFGGRPYSLHKYGRNSYDHWSVIDHWAPILIDPPIGPWIPVPLPVDPWVPVVEPPTWN